jgi:hypothetical protein
MSLHDAAVPDASGATLSSAVPVDLAAFADASAAGAASMRRAAGSAIGPLQGLVGSAVGGAASAALTLVADAVPAHGRRAVQLGDRVGAVGAAFDAVGWGVVPWGGEQARRFAVDAALAAWLWDVPDRWAAFTPGLGACPAMSLPIWPMEPGSEDEAAGVRSLTEPLAAPAQLLCDPATERRTAVAATSWITGVVVGPGGVVTATPVPVGTVVEAGSGESPRRPPHGQRSPDPDATTGMPPSGAPRSAWEDWARERGWRRSQTATGPIEYYDANGVKRLVIKEPSPRTPGSNFHRVSVRDANGWLIDVDGIVVGRRDPAGHIPATPD